MANVEDEIIYDESETIDFIYNRLEENFKDLISKDDIEYVLDVIYEYYVEKGFFDEDDEDSDGEVAIDEDEIFRFIIEKNKEEKKEHLNEEAIKAILEGE